LRWGTAAWGNRGPILTSLSLSLCVIFSLPLSLSLSLSLTFLSVRVIPDDYLIVLLNLVSDTLLPGQTRCDRVTPSISCTEGEITLI